MSCSTPGSPSRTRGGPSPEATESKYRSYYRSRLSPSFGAAPVAAISSQAITDWQAALIDSSALDTAQTARWLLDRLLDLARRRGLILVNPMVDVLPIAATRREIETVGAEPRRVLSLEEEAAVDEAFSPRYRALLTLGMDTGLRPGELYGLRASDFSTDSSGVDWLSVSRQLITVDGAARLTTRLKGEPRSRASRRTIPIYPETAAAVTAHVAELGIGRLGELFTSPEGDGFSPHNFRSRIWRPACAEAGLLTDGLPDPVPYSMRHTHASRLLAAGVALAEVSKRLGHKRQTTTLDFYSHPLGGGDVALLDALRPSMRHRNGPDGGATILPLRAGSAKTPGVA